MHQQLETRVATNQASHLDAILGVDQQDVLWRLQNDRNPRGILEIKDVRRGPVGAAVHQALRGCRNDQVVECHRDLHHPVSQLCNDEDVATPLESRRPRVSDSPLAASMTWIVPDLVSVAE